MKTDQDSPDLRAALLALTPSQALAVEGLATGDSHARAAERAGVTRETVSRWSAHHPGFGAAVDLFRYSIALEQQDAARRLRGKALACVESAIDGGDAAAALAVLRLLPAPTDVVVPLDGLSRLEHGLRERARAVPPPPPTRREDGSVDPLEPLMDFLDETKKADQAERAQRIALAGLASAAGINRKG